MLFRGKRKCNRVGGWFFSLLFLLFFLFTNKTVCTYLYACYLCPFFLFVVKNFYVLGLNNCVCKFDKNKSKNLFKKKKIVLLMIYSKSFFWFCFWIITIDKNVTAIKMSTPQRKAASHLWTCTPKLPISPKRRFQLTDINFVYFVYPIIILQYERI